MEVACHNVVIVKIILGHRDVITAPVTMLKTVIRAFMLPSQDIPSLNDPHVSSSFLRKR
jgi:hypothetical protein